MPLLFIVNAKSTLKNDPTRTVGIRKRWSGQCAARYAELARRIRNLLLNGDPGLIPVPEINPVTLRPNYEYANDPVSALRFMAWLQLQIQSVIIGNDATAASNWQNQYIDQAYERGIKRTQADIKRLGIDANMLRGVTVADIVGTATASLGAGVATGPIHQEAIRTLYVRSYSDLQGITDEMAKQIRRTLVEGIEQGKGIKDITEAINDRVDKIGLTRSQLLARTETARAYNVSAIAEFETVAENAGIEPLYEWVTTIDGRERPEHKARDGKIYTRDEAMSLIGEPNCRCALKPYIDPELMKDAS